MTNSSEVQSSESLTAVAPDLLASTSDPRKNDSPDEKEGFTYTDMFKLFILLAFIVSLIVVGANKSTRAQIKDSLVKMFEFFENHKPEGSITFFSIYVGAVIVPIPIKTIITIAAGFFYGPLIGLPLIYGGAVTGSILAFLVGRYVCTDLFLKIWERKLGSKLEGKTSRAISHLLLTEPLKTVLCLRLTPMPMEWKNYLLATSNVEFKWFAIGTTIARIFGTSNLYVFVGSSLRAVRDIAASDSQGVVQILLPSLIMGGTMFVIAIIIGFFLFRKAKRWLEEQEARLESEENEANKIRDDDTHVEMGHDDSNSKNVRRIV